MSQCPAPNCGKEFTPRRDAKTCSDTCRVRLNRHRRKRKALAAAERTKELESLVRQVIEAARAGEITINFPLPNEQVDPTK
jgi:hypothetical protein